MTFPPSPVCPLCASQGFLDKPSALPDGAWQFVCRGSHDPFVFDVDTDRQIAPYPEELVADLGLWNDLRLLVTIEHQRVEYGIVEHMYGTAHSRQYKELVAIHGHAARDPSSYTTSSLIAGILGRLRILGGLSAVSGPATGYWSYNSTISYWCPAGVEPALNKTWEEFAAERGIDPMSWPLLGSTKAQRYWNGEFRALAPGDANSTPVNTEPWDGSSESLLESVYQVSVNPQDPSHDDQP